MSRRWTPEQWSAFLRGPMADAINEQANREALEAGLFEMDSGQKLRIEQKKIFETGATLGSVSHVVLRASSDGGEGESGPGTHYAIYHEYGTYKMAARPFMRPTIDEDRNRIINAATVAYGNAIRRLF
jgi:HK97 gp10 family phage protein